jgi:transcription elongation factor Elf1
MGLVSGLEKESGNTCPRCGANALNIFYGDGADLDLCAICDECGLRGLFVNGKLVELATA